MKCAACGYIYHKEVRYVPDVTYYKSGKRKGEIKKVGEKEIIFEMGYAPFKELAIAGLSAFSTEVDDCPHGYEVSYVYICPKCKTLKVG